ncbi:MAG: glycosyltransferase, partial [Clostridia bacterium]|nr:glycosyltransferase [Clostridia bacterium]
ILPATLKTVSDFFKDEDCEILFVNDGSTDKSAKIVSVFSKETDQKIRLCGYDVNKGKGAAVRCGIENAKGDIIVYTDADLAYGTEPVLKAVLDLEIFGDDMLIGSRNLTNDGYEGYTFLRKIASKTYIRVLNIAAGFKLSDSQCGFKAFKRDCAKEVFSLCKTDGFAFDIEAILIAQKKGKKIRELPVSVINHRQSKVHVFRDTLRMLRDVMKIKKNIP